jgi:hypothetical protein
MFSCVSCSFAPGSYPYAEKYEISCGESDLVNAIEKFKEENPEYRVPAQSQLKDGRRDENDSVRVDLQSTRLTSRGFVIRHLGNHKSPTNNQTKLEHYQFFELPFSSSAFFVKETHATESMTTTSPSPTVSMTSAAKESLKPMNRQPSPATTWAITKKTKHRMAKTAKFTILVEVMV